MIKKDKTDLGNEVAFMFGPEHVKDADIEGRYKELKQQAEEARDNDPAASDTKCLLWLLSTPVRLYLERNGDITFCFYRVNGVKVIRMRVKHDYWFYEMTANEYFLFSALDLLTGFYGFRRTINCK